MCVIWNCRLCDWLTHYWPESGPEPRCLSLRCPFEICCKESDLETACHEKNLEIIIAQESFLAMKYLNKHRGFLVESVYGLGYRLYSLEF
jgi:hypothetical protein